jgi:uroporphyrinogen decarboxylase
MTVSPFLETKFIKTCKGNVLDRPPLWMMRQAGRYLPEYRSIREKEKDFMAFCFNPPSVVEATLQPIRRFDFDAAIIFSDILTIPHAMGQSVAFEAGEGPKLIPFDKKFLDSRNLDSLEPVYSAISKTRESLDQSKSLIGFSGTPWTLAAYMIACEKIGDGRLLKEETSKFLYLDDLMQVLTKAVSLHLINQIKAGCDVVQIFDSWAGLCPLDTSIYLTSPLRLICATVWGVFPDVPIIYYGRHISHLYGDLRAIEGPLVFGVDQGADLLKIQEHKRPTQGNLCPDVLIKGGVELENAVFDILEKTKNYPHIFNLGHGIKPETPIENVQKMIDLVRGNA